MADDKLIEAEVAAVVESAAAEPEVPTTTDVPAASTADPVEDTYESVTPADTTKAEPEKTNGTAAAAEEGIEVPLDENEAAAQPLTEGEKDVEAGDASKDTSPSLAAHVRILAALKKREILFPVIGGVTFLLGLILIIVALMVMQGKCDAATPDNGQTVALGKKDDSVRYADNSHMATHNHDSNSTFDESKENLAEGRLAFQTTTFTDIGVFLNASLATDGNTGNSMTKGQCAQTERQEHPVWHVDLGSDVIVESVSMLLPGDCCAGEMHDFVVRVGSETDLELNTECKHYMGTALQHKIVMDCDDSLTGRYVSIHMLGDDGRSSPRDRLTLCEVMVY